MAEVMLMQKKSDLSEFQQNAKCAIHSTLNVEV